MKCVLIILPGVAERGGGLPPPPFFDHWPPSLVKIFAKLLLSTLKCVKFSKFLACGGLIKVHPIPLVRVFQALKLRIQNTSFTL